MLMMSKLGVASGFHNVRDSFCGVGVCFKVDATSSVPTEADVRAVTGLTQEEFARRFGLDVATLRNWEQGRTRPDGPARVLLRVILRQPQAVEAALETSMP